MTDSLDAIKNCKTCSLHKNQLPTLDPRRSADIFWLGISAKLYDGDAQSPLSSQTLTGSIIQRIENSLPQLNFYSTNLVKCPPLNEKGKLRKPNTDEIDACLNNFIIERDTLKPRIIFLLGKLVAKKVLNVIQENCDIKLDNIFQYHFAIHDKTIYVPIHHPSYIGVYKRKDVESYISSIQELIIKRLEEE
ncbi:hypothetical protein IPN35_06255 [Candidatus Peregrinibacteria bacterium]|nr:MAG: hypothetical protein IPN35_06255 [Candidatus Peregrinibacteria bacterium]